MADLTEAVQRAKQVRLYLNVMLE